MPYYALYRQWRPKDFSHVVGQHAIIETLRNQVINDRIAHAYLFCGSRGTGKTSTAKILAKAINCENPLNGDPCGVCQNCLRMEREESLDIVEIDAASNNGVDEIRDLRDSVKYPPQYGKYRVYIIDEVHMLSTSAFNALLKTLEEPPAHIVFILATTEPQKLPETILSRCQRFDFGRIAISDIMGRLREAAEANNATVSNGALMVIARAAEGGMRDALSILDMCLGYGNEISEQMVRQILGTSDQAFLFRYASCLANEETGEMFRMIDQVMREGRDPAVFLKDISYHLRTLLLAKCAPKEITGILDLTQEDADEYIRQSEEFTVTRLTAMLDLFMGAETGMRYISSPRIALESISLKACLRTKEADSQALNDRISQLEDKIAELSKKLENPQILQAADSPVPKKTHEKNVKEEKPAAPPIAQPAGMASFKTVWTSVMNRMKKEQPAVWSILTQGNAMCDANGSVKWQPAKKEGSEYYISPLNREDRKNMITGFLNEASSGQYTFTAVPYAETGKTSNSSEQEYINSLYSTFGKEPVDIVEKL